VIEEEVPVIVLALVRPLPSRTACRYENVRAFG
jgi:hypothetical protein